MREIMFRGKATGLGCWVHGKSIIHLADGGVQQVVPDRIRFIDNKHSDYAWEEENHE